MNKIQLSTTIKYIFKFLKTAGFITLAAFAQANDNPLFLQKMTNPQDYNPVAAIAAQPESICGTDDLQHIENYDGRYNGIGFNQQRIENYSPSVGAIKSRASATQTSYCSGTLISNNVFLTASHCVGRGTVGDFVAFGYQNEGASNTLRASQQFFQITGILEDGITNNLDYAVLSLANNPGNAIGAFPGAQGTALGWKSVVARTPAQALIIQHPLGEPKQLDAGSNVTTGGTRLFYSDIDTQPGSSGSGVLDTSGRVAGVHTNGGCGVNGGNNSGVAMEDIIDASNVVSLPRCDKKLLGSESWGTCMCDGVILGTNSCEYCFDRECYD